MQILRYFLFPISILLFTCTTSRQSILEEDKTSLIQRRIAIIPKGNTHSYWKSVHAGAGKAAQELNVDLIWQGPAQEDGQQMQISTVQKFVADGVDAIVLAPLNEQALAPPVRAAAKRNIPVIIIDSDLQSPDFQSFIATDNLLGGKLSARHLCEQLGGKGKVIMLRFRVGSASTTARETGFLAGIREHGPAIELLSTNEYAGVTVAEAMKVSQKILRKYPQATGIFTPTETSTQGMLQALQMEGRAGKVRFVGFDFNTTLLQALEKGQIHGLAVQDPFRMGYEGIRTAVAILNQQPYEKRIDTGIMIVTKDNLTDPAVRELLNPDLNKWLKE